MALRHTSWDEPKAVSDVLKFEFGTISREVVTIASGQGVLLVGTVLGRAPGGTAASAAKSGGNTGNGTLTLDATTPVLGTAEIGTYTVRCIAAAENGGTLQVEAPDGTVLGTVAVGGTWSEQIKFATADGSADFIVGDGFDITVSALSSSYVKCVRTATNDSQVAAAVLLDKVDATSAAQTAVATVRLAEVSRLGLVFDASFDTEARKNVAIAQLAKSMVITRASA